MQAFEWLNDRLGMNYIERWLIHMPFGDVYGGWRAMEEFYMAGRIGAVEVCNFEPDRLIDLCNHAKVIPAVNQVETHPFTQQVEASGIMQSLGVQIEAWGPLAEGRNGLFVNAILSDIGRKYGKNGGTSSVTLAFTTRGCCYTEIHP